MTQSSNVLFLYDEIHLDTLNSTVSFTYSFKQSNNSQQKFNESLTFTSNTTSSLSFSDPIIHPILSNLHLALGMSYWKLFCPKDIRLDTATLTTAQAAFWNTLYTKGLGEFFFQNQIDFRELVNFPATAASAPTPQTVVPKHRVLLPFGGGKDSLVAAEMLKKKGIEFDLFAVNPHPLQYKLAEVMGKKLIAIQRTIDPQVFDLVAEKKAYDGHVPVTAFHSWIFLLIALTYDYKYVVFANEKSANYGNVEYLGETVNHQWSKSEEFEKLFQDYVEKFVVRGITTFSLMRPYYEIEIVRRFVESGRTYFPYFSSCNRNFALKGSKNPEGRLWCGACPKCAFVFALMAAFLPKAEVVDIFKKDLFADASLIPIYKALFGLTQVKPFECVGTPEETLVAFSRARMRGEFVGEPVMAMAEEVLATRHDLAQLEHEVFSAHDAPMIPKEFV